VLLTPVYGALTTEARNVCCTPIGGWPLFILDELTDIPKVMVKPLFAVPAEHSHLTCSWTVLICVTTLSLQLFCGDVITGRGTVATIATFLYRILSLDALVPPGRILCSYNASSFCPSPLTPLHTLYLLGHRFLRIIPNAQLVVHELEGA
jgi:hypothetical protein